MKKSLLGIALLILFAFAGFGQRRQPEYVYISGFNVFGFYVDKSTGALSQIPGSPFFSDAGALAADPAGHFLFASWEGIDVFTIDRASGALTLVPGSPFAAPLSPTSFAVSPSGRFLFAGFSGAIYTFSVDGNLGALTQQGPLVIGGGDLAVSPDGKFLYSGDLPPAPIQVFSINQATGTLTLLPYTGSGDSPVISADGKYLYSISSVSEPPATSLYAYSRDTNSGALTPVPGSPFNIPYTQDYYLAVEPTGRFLYNDVSLFNEQNFYGVAGLTINSLTGGIDGPVPGSPFPTTIGYVVGMLVDPSGKFLYTADCCMSAVASEFSLNGVSGSLIPISGPALPTQEFTKAIALASPKPFTTATITALSIQPQDPSVISTESATEQFTVTGTYSDGSHRFLTASVTWSSSNSNVATVSNSPGSSGLATATGDGQTTISASLGGLSAATTLTVKSAALVGIAVTPVAPAVKVGTALQFSATGTYDDGTTKDLTGAVAWRSSNRAVAIVNTSGEAYGRAAGTATIQAISGSVYGSSILTVTSN